MLSRPLEDLLWFCIGALTLGLVAVVLIGAAFSSRGKGDQDG